MGYCFSTEIIPGRRNSKTDIELFNLIGIDNINFNFEQLDNLLEKNKLKKEKNLLINENLDFFCNKIEFYSKIDTEKKEKIYLKSYQELQIPFTPEFIYLYKLNCDKYMRKDINTTFSIMNYSIKNNIIILLGILKENKYTFLNPKQNFILRVIKKTKNNIEEYQKSVDLTNIRNKSYIKKLLKDFKNDQKIFFNAMRYKRVKNKTTEMFFLKEFEIKKNLEPEFLDEKIKKNIREFYDMEMKKMLKFLITVRDYGKLFWFNKKRREIKKIFEDNFKLFRKEKIDLTNFELDSQNSFYNYYKENGTDEKNYRKSYFNKKTNESYFKKKNDKNSKENLFLFKSNPCKYSEINQKKYSLK